MPRVYKRKTEQQSWSKESLMRAVEDIQNGKISYRRESEMYNIPRTTLMRRAKTNKIHKIKLGRFEAVFNKEQEQELEQHILEMEQRFFGLTQMEFRKLSSFAVANKIEHPFNPTERLAGKDWLRGFMERNLELYLRNPENTEKN